MKYFFMGMYMCLQCVPKYHEVFFKEAGVKHKGTPHSTSASLIKDNVMCGSALSVELYHIRTSSYSYLSF